MAADTEKPLSKRALDKRMDNNVDASDTRILLIEPTGTLHLHHLHDKGAVLMGGA